MNKIPEASSGEVLHLRLSSCLIEQLRTVLRGSDDFDHGTGVRLIEDASRSISTSSRPKNPWKDSALQRNPRGGEPPSSVISSARLVAASWVGNFEAASYGVTSHKSLRWWITTVGTVTFSSETLRSDSPREGWVWVTLEIRTRPSGPRGPRRAAALAAETVPMLIPTSHTGTGARGRSHLMTASKSMACSRLVRKLSNPSALRSDGASTSATTSP